MHAGTTSTQARSGSSFATRAPQGETGRTMKRGRAAYRVRGRRRTDTKAGAPDMAKEWGEQEALKPAAELLLRRSASQNGILAVKCPYQFRHSPEAELNCHSRRSRANLRLVRGRQDRRADREPH